MSALDHIEPQLVALEKAFPAVGARARWANTHTALTSRSGGATRANVLTCLGVAGPRLGHLWNARTSAGFLLLCSDTPKDPLPAASRKAILAWIHDAAGSDCLRAVQTCPVCARTPPNSKGCAAECKACFTPCCSNECLDMRHEC